ncbi:MAG: response regulator [Rhodospirillaceae bacterium]
MVLRTTDYLSPFTILVVEPHPFMRRMMRSVLQLLGARTIIEASSVREAVNSVEHSPIDFILSESFLPGMGGSAFTKWLRSKHTDQRFTPVIMVSSEGRVEKIIEARNAGINEYVRKPFTARSLILRIREIIENPRPFVEAAKYSGPDRRRRATALDAGEDKRRPIAIDLGEGDLTQDQIDKLVAGDSIKGFGLR